MTSQLTPGEEYRVVVNYRFEYSLWPSWRPNPDGWWNTEMRGSRSECLAFVARVWKGIRRPSRSA